MKEYSNKIRKILTDITWAHWIRLGVRAHGQKNACSVDPEALLILTSLLGKNDLRLLEAMRLWLQLYGSLISLGRIKSIFSKLNLSNENKNTIYKVLGSDFKHWEKKTPLTEEDKNLLEKKVEPRSWIVQQNRLIALRFAVGVGAKADILYAAHVISHQRENPYSLIISTSILQRILHYKTLYRALDDLEASQIFSEFQGLRFGKNKVYTLNNSYSKNLLPLNDDKLSHDFCLINWLPIIKLVVEIQDLEKILNSSSNEKVIVQRINRRLGEIISLMKSACIPYKKQYASETLPLENFSPEEILERLVKQLEFLYAFIVNLIFLKCGFCEHVLVSPIQGNISALKKAELFNNTIQCSKCHNNILSSRPDFFYYGVDGDEHPLAFQ